MLSEELIGFVVEFAQRDLTTLRPGDVLNLEENLLLFLDWPPARRKEITLDALARIQKATRKELQIIIETVRQSEERAAYPPTVEDSKKELQQLIKEGKNNLTGVMTPGWAPPLPGDPSTGLWHRGGVTLHEVMVLSSSLETGYFFPLSLIQSKVEFFTQPDGKKGLRVIPPATLADCFFLAFACALNGFDLHRLHQCHSVALREKRVCGRMFVAAHGNQEFCSTQCASRERTRRLRAAARAVNDYRKKPTPPARQRSAKGTRARATA